MGRVTQTQSHVPGVGLVSGIELEIVNSCEADNGGCSHGCSHSSEGPLCTCPRGYGLDEDQKTCIGVHCPPHAPTPTQGRTAAGAVRLMSLLSHLSSLCPQPQGHPRVAPRGTGSRTQNTGEHEGLLPTGRLCL